MNEKFEDDIEAIWLDICIHSQKMMIGTLYRHLKDLEFYKKLEKVLETILTRRKNLTLIEDLNSDLSKKGGQPEEKVLGKRLVNILKSQNLHNIIKEPTRITQKTQTLIDLFIKSKKELIQEPGVIHLGISDYSLIYDVYKILVEKEKPVFKKVIN